MSDQNSPKKLLSPRDCAKLLSISTRKLWSMTFAETPGLPYVRLGRLVRYRPGDVDHHLDLRQSLKSQAGEGVQG